MTGVGPGQVLFGFVRHWSRRSMTDEPELAERGRLVLVIEAVASLTRRGIAATVNAVAHEIGIDQSGASRLVKSAVAAGCLAMAASDADGRRRQVTVTASGTGLLARAHDWQEQVFQRLTHDWSRARRREFQLAMTELMERSHGESGG